MSLTIREFLPEDRAPWDRFVQSHPHGSPFHLTAWKRTLESTFGYQSRYLLALDGDAVEAVLPLFLIENFMMGRVLLSSPFAVYGGILAASEQARLELGSHVAELGKRLGVEHVELRNAWPEQCVGFRPVNRYVTFTQEVSPMTGEELLQVLSKKTRNMVRKALKFDYSSRPAANLDHFYRLLCHSYRRLGTPVFPRRYFETLVREFGPIADVREIVLDGKVAATSLNLIFRGEMHTYYAASDQRYLPSAPNNYLYYDHLLWAGQNGCHLFDFGRSKLGTGTYDFKSHWLTTMRALPYEVFLVKRKEMPNFSPKNPKFEMAIRVWQKVPLPLTRIAGPYLVRLFP